MIRRSTVSPSTSPIVVALNNVLVASSPIAAVAVEAMVGASLSAATVTCTWTAVSETIIPSKAFTVKAFRVPLASSAGVQTRLSPLPRVVDPSVTATPPLVSVPVVIVSILKLIASPSASASFAAAANVS